MARAMGVSRQAVFKWAANGIPKSRVEKFSSLWPDIKLDGATSRGRGWWYERKPKGSS